MGGFGRISRRRFRLCDATRALTRNAGWPTIGPGHPGAGAAVEHLFHGGARGWLYTILTNSTATSPRQAAGRAGDRDNDAPDMAGPEAGARATSAGARLAGRGSAHPAAPGRAQASLREVAEVQRRADRDRDVASARAAWIRPSRRRASCAAVSSKSGNGTMSDRSPVTRTSSTPTWTASCRRPPRRRRAVSSHPTILRASQPGGASRAIRAHYGAIAFEPLRASTSTSRCSSRSWRAIAAVVIMAFAGGVVGRMQRLKASAEPRAASTFSRLQLSCPQAYVVECAIRSITAPSACTGPLPS